VRELIKWAAIGGLFALAIMLGIVAGGMVAGACLSPDRTCPLPGLWATLSQDHWPPIQPHGGGQDLARTSILPGQRAAEKILELFLQKA
jgi:hypothetical protein